MIDLLRLRTQLVETRDEVARLRAVVEGLGPAVEPQPALLPCPFCGGVAPRVRLLGPMPTLALDRVVYAVRCLPCGFEGGGSTTPTGAVNWPDGWNRRAGDTGPRCVVLLGDALETRCALEPGHFGGHSTHREVP